MNKRQEIINELIKADQDGTWKTIYQKKNTHKLLKVEKQNKSRKTIKGTNT